MLLGIITDRVMHYSKIFYLKKHYIKLALRSHLFVRFCFFVPKRAHESSCLNKQKVLKIFARRHLHLTSLGSGSHLQKAVVSFREAEMGKIRSREE